MSMKKRTPTECITCLEYLLSNQPDVFFSDPSPGINVFYFNRQVFKQNYVLLLSREACEELLHPKVNPRNIQETYLASLFY
jgi:hypothetical protein